jgi:hypothetical protein
MKLWRLPFTIIVASVIAASAHHANAQVKAGTYTCATVTVNAAGQITAISANPCVQPTLELYSGGDITLYAGGSLLCYAC